MTTIDGMPFDDWLMTLTPEDVEKVQRPPGKKRRLSLDWWKLTSEGWAVFKRQGQKGLEVWAAAQTKKLYTYKKLQMQALLELVEKRLGQTKQRDHSPKGTFLKKTRFRVKSCNRTF